MTTAAEIKHLVDHGLYSKAHEHDACGVGFVAHIRDGAGILIQLPDALYREEMARNGTAPDGSKGVALPPLGEYGVGMIFLPKEHASRLACEQEMERAIKAEGQVLLGWRDVP
ncbi:MAG: hypothetical protein CFE44_12305, partial [Burkholderiales bacterium PBB4]